MNKKIISFSAVLFPGFSPCTMCPLFEVFFQKLSWLGTKPTAFPSRCPPLEFLLLWHLMALLANIPWEQQCTCSYGTACHAKCTKAMAFCHQNLMQNDWWCKNVVRVVQHIQLGSQKNTLWQKQPPSPTLAVICGLFCVHPYTRGVNPSRGYGRTDGLKLACCPCSPKWVTLLIELN